MQHEINFEDVKPQLERYENQLTQELSDLVNSWPSDLEIDPIPRVLGALVARHVTLASQVVADPFFWNPDVGPLVLRPLLESWLKIEWILKSPLKRTIGLAKADLNGAKNRVQELSETTRNSYARTDSKSLLEMLASEENLFASDGKPVMVDSWKMAKTLGGQAQVAYRRHHVRMSSCAHGAWNHIARYNLAINTNPLHRNNFIPVWRQPDTDLNFALIAADYCDRVFQAIRRDGRMSSSYSELIVKLEKLGIVQNLPSDEEEFGAASA